MNETSERLDNNEIRAELGVLRKKIKDMEAGQTGRKPAAHAARGRGFSRGVALGLLLLLISALLIGSVLGAQRDHRAFFIDEQGNVAIATNLDAGGRIRASTLEGDGSALNLEGNKSIRALQADKLDKTGGTILGKLNIGRSNAAGPPLNVEGEIAADNVWTRLHEAQLSSAADYTVKGLNGDAYRQFRIELEGTVTTENYGYWTKAIGIRPNGNADATNYGTHQELAAAPWTFGQNATDFLPLCVSHWLADGQVSCAGEMNTHTGMSRIMRSESLFITLADCSHHPWSHLIPQQQQHCILSQDAANAWFDQSTNITSLTLYFGKATGFTGRFVLYGRK